MFAIEFDRTKCIKCGSCARICCNSNVIKIGTDGYPVFADAHKCISCGHCIAICPGGGISTKNTRSGAADSHVAGVLDFKKKAHDPDVIQQLLAGLRSTRFFLDTPVEDEKVHDIIDIMVRSPSAGNEQNRHYYVFANKDQIARMEADVCRLNAKGARLFSNPLFKLMVTSGMKSNCKKVFAEIGVPLTDKEVDQKVSELFSSIARERSNFFFKNAPVVIIVASDVSKKGMHSDFYKSDVELAVTYGTVLASSMGLSCCRLGLSEIMMNRDLSVRLAYGIPRNQKIYGILALGYSDTDWKRIPPRGPAHVVWNR